MKDYGLIRTRIVKEVQDRLLVCINADDEEVLKMIEESILYEARECELNNKEALKLRKEVFNRIRRLDVLQDLLDDDSVTEIMVNGVEEIFVERGGRLTGSGLFFESKERLRDIITSIAAKVNRSVNLSSPILDARLEDGSRVNVVLDPIAINGPILTIRRFPNTPLTAKDLIKSGSVTVQALDTLRNLVVAGYNILISGGTGSGKTTFLNCVSAYIPSSERIITIEDSAELKIMGIRNLVSLETRNATSEGVKGVSIRDLIKTALRMRPDRIIVGEVRGEEAIDMLQAFNVGQDGSLSTIHANSAEDALARLETMVMLHTQIPLIALRRQIASGVDIVVHLSRLRDKSRHVLEIMEVIGINGTDIVTKPLYEFVEEQEKEGKVKGKLIKMNSVTNKEKLIKAGITYEL